MVSILIPAFNVQEWIGETLRSAIAQTWEPTEVIVVDDGSTDQTLEIARSFESKSFRIVTQENNGAASARNKAFSLSRGDYIQWLDGDDLLAPDKIERQMEVINQCQSKRTLVTSAWGNFRYRRHRGKVRAYSPVVRSVAYRLVAAEDGPGPLHADGHLACQSRTHGSSRAVGHKITWRR